MIDIMILTPRGLGRGAAGRRSERPWVLKRHEVAAQPGGRRAKSQETYSTKRRQELHCKPQILYLTVSFLWEESCELSKGSNHSSRLIPLPSRENVFEIYFQTASKGICRVIHFSYWVWWRPPLNTHSDASFLQPCGK